MAKYGQLKTSAGGTAFTTSGTESVAFDWPGGKGMMICGGTWDSGTATLYLSPDAGTTYLTTGEVLTADGVNAFELPAGKLKLGVACSTDTSVFGWVLHMNVR